jgi:hypothetical protein
MKRKMCNPEMQAFASLVAARGAGLGGNGPASDPAQRPGELWVAA